MSDDTLLGEHLLRRALRLDADELPARFDPAVIAAAARMARPDARVIGGAALVAFALGWAWSELLRAIVDAFTAATGIDPVAVGIGLVADGAVAAAPVIGIAMQPAVPIAILVAALGAALFERGRPHVTAPS